MVVSVCLFAVRNEPSAILANVTLVEVRGRRQSGQGVLLDRFTHRDGRDSCGGGYRSRSWLPP